MRRRDGHTEGGAAGLVGEPRGDHVMRGHVLTDVPQGAHVKKGDPLLVLEQRALHAMKGEGPVTPDPSTPRERRARRTSRQGAHKAMSRRWGLVPVAGAAGALAVGLGGGGAFAFFSSGPGTGDAPTGSAVTLKAVATTGPADLLPGDAGAVYFTVHNTDSFGATFDQVAPGATVVSDNTALCPSSEASIAQTLPYSFSPAITVSPGGTSGSQSIAGLVELAPNAPGTCQGVTFTVTLTLSGRSS
jgi:hypothetical protein